MKEYKEMRNNVIASFVLIVLSLVCFTQLQKVAAFEAKNVQSLSGTFWPTLVIILIVFTSLCMGIPSLVKLMQLRKTMTEKPTFSFNFGMAMAFIILVLYVFLAKYVGFILITPFFLFAFMYMLDTRRYLLMVSCSLLTTVAVVVLFIKVLYIPLPLGIGIFKSINLLFF
ncbi:MAG: tripartite tricarboxylate transporter TctB family protein [Dehalobacterium sp.]